MLLSSSLLMRFFIVLSILASTPIAHQQDQPQQKRLVPSQQQQQQQQEAPTKHQFLLRRLMANDIPYQQFSIQSILDSPKLQQDVLLHINASPIKLSALDLTEMENEFHNAYNRQQNLACAGEPGVDYYPVYVTSCQIQDNNDAVIVGFGNEPRTISKNVDFSFIMAVNYSCFGCPDNNYDIMNLNLYHHHYHNDYYNDNNDTPTNSSSSSLHYDPRDSYQVPFPSSLLEPCMPYEADVAYDYIQNSNLLFAIDGLNDIYSIDLIPTTNHHHYCNDDSNFTPFSTFFTIAVEGDYHNVPDLEHQLAMIKEAIIEVYNEMNVLNPHTCDNYSRIVTNANVTIVDPKMTGATNGKYLYSWYFLHVEIIGSCDGCLEGSCLTTDVSGFANCIPLEDDNDGDNNDGRRHLTNNTETNNNGLSCYCVDNMNATLYYSTNEDFQDVLQTQFELLRNETNFTMVSDIVFLIETGDVPDSCCGYPVTGNIPVNVHANDFRDAITSYLDTGYSPYGNFINCWDVSNVTSMSTAFQDQTNFTDSIGCWDTGKVVNVRAMFNRATNFNSDISMWDTSNIVVMQDMFYEATSFNGNLSLWDTSNVATMLSMFHSATSFDGDLSSWDTSKVISMIGMFRDASNFTNDYYNSSLSNWNTSQVESMSLMFSGASNFNNDISNWDVSNVRLMNNMFQEATSFNIDISKWNIKKSNDISSMFQDASQFRQNLCPWDLIASQFLLFISFNIFSGSNCSNTRDPTPFGGGGPWCFDCE